MHNRIFWFSCYILSGLSLGSELLVPYRTLCNDDGTANSSQPYYTWRLVHVTVLLALGFAAIRLERRYQVVRGGAPPSRRIAILVTLFILVLLPSILIRNLPLNTQQYISAYYELGTLGVAFGFVCVLLMTPFSREPFHIRLWPLVFAFVGTTITLRFMAQYIGDIFYSENGVLRAMCG